MAERHFASKEAKHYLILPTAKAMAVGAPPRVALVLKRRFYGGPAYGGIMLRCGKIFSRVDFRIARDRMGGYVESEAPEQVRAALGLFSNEPGIVAMEVAKINGALEKRASAGQRAARKGNLFYLPLRA